MGNSNRHSCTNKKCGGNFNGVCRQPFMRCNRNIDLAFQALQEKLERENPQPLTLGELREMEGKPVWVETMQQWRIVTINRENNYLVCLLAEYNTISAKHVFNNDGRVYLHKPKEADPQ